MLRGTARDRLSRTPFSRSALAACRFLRRPTTVQEPAGAEVGPRMAALGPRAPDSEAASRGCGAWGLRGLTYYARLGGLV